MTVQNEKSYLPATNGNGATGVARRLHGIHWFAAGLFIVADMAGGGVVAMPGALKQAGFIGGIVNILLIAIAFAYTSHLLGQNWNTMCERWPEYHDHCRKPYPEMAYRAFGPTARKLTSGTLVLMLYGVSIVYFTLSAHILSNIMTGLFPFTVSTCQMIVVIGLIMLPVTFLRSPADFQSAVIGAMITTTLSVGLIIAGIILDWGTCNPVVQYPEFSSHTYLMSLGTIMFSFGGHAVFPTIQHDMHKPGQFTKSTILAFIVVLIMYLPITFFGYATYGDSLRDNIINSLQSGMLQQAANFFIAIHCVLTLTIIINPLNQELEHKLKVPHGFSLSRIVCRTVVMVVIVFSALTFPKFGPILNFIGGTAVALTSAIMPCLFNLYLHANDEYETGRHSDSEDSEDEQIGLLERTKRVLQRTSPVQLVLCVIIIALGVVCGTVTTYSSVIEIMSTNFGQPCYWPSDATQLNTTTTATDNIPIHCCGPYRNVTRLPEYTCPI